VFRKGKLSDEMILTIGVWLCSLPVIALLVLPGSDYRAAGLLALVLLAAFLAVCWGSCGWRMGRREKPWD
jgi:hypothetical protein